MGGFSHALRGLAIFFKTTKKAWVHLVCALAAAVLGIYFQVSIMEWLVLLLVIGIVFITEAINTAIEIDINLTSPEYHPYARDTKDVAAGAVLISAVMAIVAGALIFLPKILVYARM